MFLQLLTMNKFAIVCHSLCWCEHWYMGWGGEWGGSSRLPKNIKINIFMEKINRIMDDNILSMIILIIPEMNIIDYHFNLTSWSLFFIKKDNRNNDTDVSLLVLKVFRYLRRSYFCNTMGQTRQSSITIINTERSYANHILQELMGTIISIFGKRKNCESFLFKTIEPYMQSVHVLIILLFFVRKTVSLNLIVSKFFTNNIV